MKVKDMTPEIVCGLIDHTLLKPDATAADVARVCKEAVAYGFRTVCVSPCRLPLALKLLRGKKPRAITVAGFPLGFSATEIKKAEAALYVEKGAAEIDMVINVGALKDGDNRLVLKDIKAVVAACGKIPVKVIIETCLLTRQEKITACMICVDAGAAFVKTSTGLSTGGATVEDIILMRRTVGPDFGVKAAGGIKTYDDAVRLIRAGANRIGTSSSAAIASGKGKTDAGY